LVVGGVCASPGEPSGLAAPSALSSMASMLASLLQPAATTPRTHESPTDHGLYCMAYLAFMEIYRARTAPAAPTAERAERLQPAVTIGPRIGRSAAGLTSAAAGAGTVSFCAAYRRAWAC